MTNSDDLLDEFDDAPAPGEDFLDDEDALTDFGAAGTEDELETPITKILHLYGIGEDFDLSEVTPFRISTIPEILLFRLVMQERYGLDTDEYVENPWGFPFIPRPVANTVANDKIVRLPRNVNYDISGHPIYWIDPKLTAFTREELEDPPKWAVRMFYTILGMGLLDPETLSWYNAPQSMGVRYTDAELRNHLDGGASTLEEVLYTAEDFKIPYPAILKQTKEAYRKIAQIQSEQWTTFRSEQAAAQADATRIISGETNWEQVMDRVQALCENVAERVAEGRPVSNYVQDLFDVKDEVVEHLNDMERLIIILNTPLLRNYAASAEVYYRVVTTLKEYRQRVEADLYGEELAGNIAAIFEATSLSDPAVFMEFAERCEALYTDAWRRLHLVMVNYDRIADGRPAYSSYEEYQLMDEIHDASEDGDDTSDLTRLSDY